MDPKLYLTPFPTYLTGSELLTQIWTDCQGTTWGPYKKIQVGPIGWQENKDHCHSCYCIFFFFFFFGSKKAGLKPGYTYNSSNHLGNPINRYRLEWPRLYPNIGRVRNCGPKPWLASWRRVQTWFFPLRPFGWWGKQGPLPSILFNYVGITRNMYIVHNYVCNQPIF